MGSTSAQTRKYIAMDCGGTKLHTVIHLPGKAPLYSETTGVGHGSGDLANHLIMAITSALPKSSDEFDLVAISLAAIPVDISHRNRIISSISSAISVKKIILVTDSLAAYYACSSGKDLVIAIGTGITAICEVDSEVIEISGHGYLYGDEASAFWLGKNGINSALQSFDGRGSHTQLLPAALEHFDTTAENLTDTIHQLARPVPAISEFAQIVLKLAESGDGVAQDIVKEAVEEVWKIVTTARRRTEVCSVKLIGGMVTNSEFFFDQIARYLISKDPSLLVEKPSRAPIDGVIKIVDLDLAPDFHKEYYLFEGGKELSGKGLYAPALYLNQVAELLLSAQNTNKESLRTAIDYATSTVIAGGLIHTFGTGHSHLLAEEIFYRAGGLASIYPILDERLMLHKDVIEASQHERLSGLHEELLADHPIKRGDTVIIISNSGGNQVSIDLAIRARELGAHVCVLTSVKTAQSSSARVNSGKKLHDYADVVLDNCGVAGDALVSLPGVEYKVGPTSTVIGAALLQALIVGVVEKLHNQGFKAEVFLSSNMQGGDESNQALFAKYFEIIPIYR